MMLRNQKGIALPLVLIVMIILGLLGTVVLQFGVTDAQQTARDLHRTQAYYAARAGADAMAEYLVKNPSQIAPIVTQTSFSQMAQGQLTAGQTFSVDVFGDIVNGITITSEGESNGITRRVALELQLMDAAAIFEDVIYTYGDLDVSQMKTIIGDVTSAGNITIPNGFGYDSNPYTYRFYPSPTFPDPALPPDPNSTGGAVNIGNGDEYTIAGEYHYTNITMAPNGKLIFRTSGTNMRVVVDNLETKGSVIIDNSAGGRVELFITTSADIQTPLVVNSGDPNHLIIYLADGVDFTMSANGVTQAYIYGPYANISVQSAHSTIFGAVIANVVVRMPNGTQPSIGNFIYHPPDDDFGGLNPIIILTRNQWRDVQ
jgi:hypothetical protein